MRFFLRFSYCPNLAGIFFSSGCGFRGHSQEQSEDSPKSFECEDHVPL